MKSIKSILLFSCLISITTSQLQADVWQDIVTGINKISQKTDLPIGTKGKSNTLSPEVGTPMMEHAQRLAHNASLRAAEAANVSMSTIKNAALHLTNMQQINRVAEYLNNIIHKKGDSLAQVEEAKRLLHEILSEARKLERNAKEASKQIESTLRKTTRLAQHLGSKEGINPALSKIWKSIKEGATKPTSTRLNN